jgi:alpha-beta hydrolase superfamily lysophospholipase
MLRAMERLLAEARRITLPLLIVQGGADRLVDPAGARMLCDAVGSSDRKLIVYEGLYHEVFNEPERDRVFADLQTWLEAHRG